MERLVRFSVTDLRTYLRKNKWKMNSFVWARSEHKNEPQFKHNLFLSTNSYQIIEPHGKHKFWGVHMK